ncbi:hypothetical protein [Loktanella sp. SALINAS62]|uniref:hypothetical protein n=1 Tax=Loktanella sp. SALINAS62 TaxID=2706124 RepID=UPI001B8C558A|nr:hypothetical protein [Loktanella sp. SALINAS62]MBS1303418.1 hypothetical protein [Loktanella sp. SALINAS62]
MAVERKPRQKMPVPGLTDRDRASIATTAKANGLGKAEADTSQSEPTPVLSKAPPAHTKPDHTSKAAPAEHQYSDETVNFAPTNTPQTPVRKPEPAAVAADLKQLRVTVAHSSDLALAIHDKLLSLSPDAQKFASSAILLREFLREHDEELAKIFRKTNGLQ